MFLMHWFPTTLSVYMLQRWPPRLRQRTTFTSTSQCQEHPQLRTTSSLGWQFGMGRKNRKVCCKFRIQPKKFYDTKQQRKAPINTSRMSQPDLVEQFPTVFEKEVGALQHEEPTTKKWEELQNTIHHKASATFGKKSSVSRLVWSQDIWIDSCHQSQAWSLLPALEGLWADYVWRRRTSWDRV